MPLSDATPETPPAQKLECTSCAGGTLAPDRVKTAFWRRDELMVIDDIPALVCQSCGERYFEDETAMTLDRMRSGLCVEGPPARVLSVPVFSYAPPRSVRDEEDGS